MSTLRFYETSWLIHHHAAIRSARNIGGLSVLSQSGRFINESHRLFSMKMDYVLCYYRPDNKFPSHVFGGAARNINDPKICSVDEFAYSYFNKKEVNTEGLPSEWRLDYTSEEDLYDLQTYYEDHYGGLMLHGLHISPDRCDCTGIVKAFRRIGLKRERHLFALRKSNKLCAVIMANVSDLGLNLSELTNAITVIVVNRMELDKDILNAAIGQFSNFYEPDEVPLLLYPQQEAKSLGISPKKNYMLWIYNAQNLDPYFRFLKRLLKFVQH